MTKKRMLMLMLMLMLGFIFLCDKSKNVKDGFFCTADTSIYSGGDILKMTLNFHAENGVGYITLRGVMDESNSNKTSVSLMKEFWYSESDGEFLFSQMPDGVLEVSDSDRVILKKFIPEFYLNNKISTHHVRVKKLREGLWIFTTEPVPYFVCEEY
jgi:hypothetical protein